MKEARKRRHKNGHDNSKINYEVSQSEQFLFPNIRKLSQALGESIEATEDEIYCNIAKYKFKFSLFI